MKSTCSRVFFFFQAEDGIRDHCVTGVQTCALPISRLRAAAPVGTVGSCGSQTSDTSPDVFWRAADSGGATADTTIKNGRGSGRERGKNSGGAVSLKKKKNHLQRM